MLHACGLQKLGLLVSRQFLDKEEFLEVYRYFLGCAALKDIHDLLELHVSEQETIAEAPTNCRQVRGGMGAGLWLYSQLQVGYCPS